KDGARHEAEPVKTGLGGGSIAICHQRVAEFDADDFGGVTNGVSEIVVKGEIEVALARTHIDDAGFLGLDRLNQWRENLDHLVDLPELILRIIAHLAVLAGDAQSMQIRLV